MGDGSGMKVSQELALGVASEMIGCGLNLSALASSTALLCFLGDLREAHGALAKGANSLKQPSVLIFLHSAVLCGKTPLICIFFYSLDDGVSSVNEQIQGNGL